MYKKSFVSISVSTTKIKLVKLSSDGKRVAKFATYEIPEGLVDRGRVQKAGEFAALIQSIWKKEHIHDRNVGIVVPEFSTFMKVLSLPKIAVGELDEAVRWQAREFLPHEGAEMILDWKLIEETKDGYEVLVVAIDVDVLSGFVGALDAAGLLPVFVETTSLCLERLGESKNEGKLVLYRSHGTTVATIIFGKKILATSVLNVHEDAELVTDILQMLARYSRDEIKKISVCGNGINQEFINTLHLKAGLEVEFLKIAIEGLHEGEIQDYIIALSQQSVNPEEPSNEYSINLLPPSWVTHYRNQLRDLRIWTLTLITSVVVWSCLLTSLASYVILTQRSQESDTPSPTQNANELKAVVSEITEVNNLSNKVGSITKNIQYPQDVINLVASKSGDLVNVTSYDVNLETGKFSLSGTALTRESLLKYKTELEKEKSFSKVTLPLTSLLTDKDITFSIQMDYKKTQ